MTRDVRLLNTGSLLELSRRLRSAGGENIRRSMHRRIRRAAEPLRSELQDSIRSLEIRSAGRSTRPGGPSPTSRPLRSTIADAIRISVRAGSNPGARVWVDKGQLPPDLKRMPEVLNSGPPPGRVRHPVFGNKRRWANQYVKPFWWDATVRKHTPRMEREVARIVDDVRRRIE